MAKDEEKQIEIQEMLKDGWEIAGYSTNVLHSGLFCHHILLRNDCELTTVTITSGKDEVGRGITQIAPAPEKKKGFWG